ncbi:MAG: efflux RND transporter periplasmic adaptor subunit [Desulfuromonas sp.]|nr:efflux RND transporter periplasmic adaptor subunit [Desulfuromonas sp.]
MSQTPPHKTLYKKWLPLIVLLCAITATVLLIKSRQPPAKHPFIDRGTLVEVQQMTTQDVPLHILATGTVQPQQQLRLSPQVSGKVVALHPQFHAGGDIRQGELLLTIDPRDYALALTKAQNSLSSALLNFEQVTNQAEVARNEWRVINGSTPPPPLAALEPQKRQAQAAVRAAEADVQLAELNLSRTKLYAPFDSRILSEQIDLGQNLTSGREIAILIGTAKAEVVIPIPLSELPWLEIGNKHNQDRKKPAATISLTTPRQRYHWSGDMDRTLAAVDEQGRMSRIVVTVDAPYATHPELPLQAGMFVDVELQGITLKEIFTIPRSALRDNSSLWLVDEDQRLKIKPITIVRKERDRILVRGLTANEQVIISAISGAADGMKLRIKTPIQSSGVTQ